MNVDLDEHYLAITKKIPWPPHYPEALREVPVRLSDIKIKDLARILDRCKQFPFQQRFVVRGDIDYYISVYANNEDAIIASGDYQLTSKDKRHIRRQKIKQSLIVHET